MLFYSRMMYSFWIDYKEKNYYDQNTKNNKLSTYNRADKIFNFKFWLHDLDYFVLDTDYENYLIGYFCSTSWFGTQLKETFYILKRNNNFNLDLISEAITKTLDYFKLKTFRLKNDTCNRHTHRKKKQL